MLSVERPSTNASLGSSSAISAVPAPAAVESTSHTRASRANRAGHGMPGSACSRLATATATATVVRARRGRTMSDAASTNDEASRATSGPPNMLSPVSSADPVSAWTIVPSARPDVAPAAMVRHWVTNRVRNSATPNSSR